MKRVLRTLLIAVMAAMLMALPAMAAGSPSVGVDSASAKAGESVTLDISISSNPGFVSGKVTVTYDTAALELTDLSNVMFAGDAYAPTGMANHSSVDPVTGDGVLVSATFKVKEGTADGAYNVSASVSGMRDGNDALMTVHGGSGTITVTHDHVFGNWKETTPATCTTDAVETGYCTAANCTETTTRKGASATGHSFGEWKETTAPTCTVKGTETRTCACGEKETREIPATGHSFGEWKETTAPTCTVKGTETRTCVCGETETRDVAATGHSYGAWTTTKNPTCSEAGSEQRQCSACGNIETASLGTIDHSFVLEGDASGHWYVCSNCGHCTAKEAHTPDNSGMCQCGYQVTTVEDNPKLDNVPKTGDITPMIVFASMIFICMISGTAFVFGRRRAK